MLAIERITPFMNCKVTWGTAVDSFEKGNRYMGQYQIFKKKQLAKIPKGPIMRRSLPFVCHLQIQHLRSNEISR